MSNAQNRLTSKNLLVISVIVVSCSAFIALGFWQIFRAEYNQKLLDIINQKKSFNYTKINLLSFSQPSNSTRYKNDQSDEAEWNYKKVELVGSLIEGGAWFYDNQTNQGEVGYHLMQLFREEKSRMLVLLNRGFIAKNFNNQSLIAGDYLNKDQLSENNLSVIGYFYQSVNRWVFKEEDPKYRNSQIVQTINWADLEQQRGEKIFPWVLNLSEKSPLSTGKRAMVVNSQINPYKNYGYAFQWFSFALILVLGSVIYWWKNRSRG